MKIDVEPTDSIRSIHNEIINRVSCSQEELDLFGHPKDWHPVRQEIGKYMEDISKGRPTPQKKTTPRMNREAFRMLLDPVNNFRSYPRRVTTDNDKFHCLKDWYRNGTVNTQIFLDLASVLKLKEESAPLDFLFEVMI